MARPKTIVIDEFHLTVRVPSSLTATEYAAVKQTLDDTGFQEALRRAVRSVVQPFAALSKVRLAISR